VSVLGRVGLDVVGAPVVHGVTVAVIRHVVPRRLLPALFARLRGQQTHILESILSGAVAHGSRRAGSDVVLSFATVISKQIQYLS
jgi:hypothetical protein